MKNKKFSIIVNTNQLKVIRIALETLCDLHGGQWDSIIDRTFRRIFNKKHPYFRYWERIDEKFDIHINKDLSYRGTFYETLNILKMQLLELNPSAAIGMNNSKVDSQMATAFDIRQVLDTKLGCKKQPMQFDKANNLAIVEEVIEKDDIHNFGIFNDGLTDSEIKEYLKKQAKGTKFAKMSISKLYKEFCKIAGVNTMSLVIYDKHQIVLMYRHDVKRFADKLLLGIPTYFD